MKLWQPHIGRGVSKHNKFITQYIPRVVESLSSRGTTSIDENKENICQTNKVEVNLNSKHSFSPFPFLEIVIPRCCESISGDLRWLQTLLSIPSVRSNSSYLALLRISVYYKCPWCVPESKLSIWENRLNLSAAIKIINAHGYIDLFYIQI